MKLVDAIESHHFSPEAEAMFTTLAQNGPTDEGRLVVVCAAAYILTRDFPEGEVLAETGALLAHVRADIIARAPRPRLRLVGGRDV